MAKSLSPNETAQLLQVLETRFEKNLVRHSGLRWQDVQARLKTQPGKLWSLHEMEKTGGEPDVVSWDKKTGEFHFFDCLATAGSAMCLFITMAPSRITRAGAFAVG